MKQTPKYKDLSGVYYVASQDRILLLIQDSLFLSIISSDYSSNVIWLTKHTVKTHKENLSNKKYGIKRIGEL